MNSKKMARVLFVIILLLSSCTKKDKIDPLKLFFSEDEKKEIAIRIENISDEIKKGENISVNKIERAKYLLLLQKFNNALEDLDSDELTESHYDALFLRAFIHFELGNDEKAFSDLTKLKKIHDGIEEKKLQLVKKRSDLLISSLKEREDALPPRWQKLLNNENCLVWNPSPKKEETVEWDGNCKNGKIEGKGILKWISYHLDGEAKNGYIEGSVKLKFHNGTLFQGNMTGSEITGQGEWIYSSGVVFKVEYGEKKPFNIVKGTYIFPDGSKYEGRFFNDRPDESGNAWCADGKTTQFRVIRRESVEKIWDIVFNCK